MNSDQKGTEGTVVNTTFRPDLFAVAIGSYLSNVVYGSDADAFGPSYNGVTVRLSTSPLLQTTGFIRHHDKGSDFELQITLDTSATDPWDGLEDTGELRIRTLPKLVSEPGNRLNHLLIPENGLPLFDNVEILDQLGRNVLPSQTNNILQARYLFGSEIALVRKNLTLAPTASIVPLTTADLSPLFGGPITSVRIIVRGSYITNANPTGH